MFEKMMKYPIDVFREGNFSFGVPLPGLPDSGPARRAIRGYDLGISEHTRTHSTHLSRGSHFLSRGCPLFTRFLPP